MLGAISWILDASFRLRYTKMNGVRVRRLQLLPLFFEQARVFAGCVQVESEVRA